MDLIFRLIEFLVRAALDQNKGNQMPPPGTRSHAQVAVTRPQTGPQQLAQPGQVRSQPLVPRGQVGTRDPVYDDGGWRTVLTVLALIALVFIVLLWIVYIMGRA